MTIAKSKEPYKLSKMQIILFVIAVLIAAVQILAVILYSVNVGANFDKLHTAVLVYEKGIFEGYDILMMLVGLISKAIGIHPMILVFTYLPIVLIPFYYLNYYYLLKKMLGNSKEKALVAVIIVELLCIWGYNSKALACISILLSYATTLCFLVHGICPILARIIINISEKQAWADRRNSKESEMSKQDNISSTSENVDENEENYQEEWDMKKHKIINARNLAIALGVLALALVAFVFVLNNKINTLHDATANLSEDLLSRSRIYDYVTDNGSVEGNLIIGTDGSLTFIGGGAEENADSLADFIGKYGDTVTNWYLYGDEEENVGAYIRCVMEKGIKAENVYILSRTKIEGFN